MRELEYLKYKLLKVNWDFLLKNLEFTAEELINKDGKLTKIKIPKQTSESKLGRKSR